MMAMRDGGKFRSPCWLALLVCVVGGCKESGSESLRPELKTVTIVGNDMNRDGTISESGLQKIQAEAKEPKIAVTFLRVPLTDAGLNQVAKFPNVKRVEAAGSRITPAGIERLKRALPEVEVLQ
jgi:hypothetical protein